MMLNEADRELLASWDRIKQRLRAELGEEIYSSWFGRVELESLSGNLLRLSVPTKFLLKWLQTHYATQVLSICSAELANVTAVEFQVRSPDRLMSQRRSAEATERPAAAPPADGTPVREPVVRAEPAKREPHVSAAPAAVTPAPASAAAAPMPSASGEGRGLGSPLNPRQTFNTFMVSASNRLAFAAAKQIAEGLSQFQPKYNPLFFHADVGRGKTHLMQAIAWELKQMRGEARVVYLTAERFMHDFAESLRTQTAHVFKDRLRAADVMLVDDIQFLKGETNQKEFEHIINALIDSGRQVVVASALSPAKLKGLDPRMRSRLAGGLVAEMESFDRELRLRILQLRAREEAGECPGFVVPEEVMSLLADRLTESGRELEGAITRLRASYQLTNQAVTMRAAMDMVGAIVGAGEPRRVRIDDILRAISEQYSVSRGDLLSSRRTRSIVRPRQIGMYLSKQLTSRSLPEIGRRFGGRDHTTVIHAIRKIEELMNEDPGLRDEIECLKKDLHE
jgi:chromosomal replication initiator protein